MAFRSKLALTGCWFLLLHVAVRRPAGEMAMSLQASEKYSGAATAIATKAVRRVKERIVMVDSEESYREEIEMEVEVNFQLPGGRHLIIYFEWVC
jgi:hypothetical protein